MKKKGKMKKRKEPAITLEQVLKNMEQEAMVIGLKADMGDPLAQAVIAQYVHYLHHSRDPERIRLLRECYADYEKANRKANLKLIPSDIKKNVKPS